MRAESQLPVETSSPSSSPPLASDSTATEAPSPSSMTFTSYTDVTSSVVIDVLHRHVQDTDDKTRNGKSTTPLSSPTRATPGRWKIAAVYAAFIVFGLGSWIMTNSVFIETAALFQQVPEKAAISAYLIVALQAANIFPTLYMVFNSDQQLFSIRSAIWVLLALGVVTCLLLSQFWDITSVFWGHEHSSALLALVFFGGAVSATTTVVYYPFVATFPPVFTSALSTGEGLSGVVAGVLGIWQDPGASTMHLSVSHFFTCAAGVFGIAMVAYWFLATSTISAQVQHSKYNEDPGEFECKFTPPTKPRTSSSSSSRTKTSINGESIPLVSNPPQRPPHIFLSSTHRRDYVLRNLWKPLMFQVLLCAMSFGVIPSIMPFLGSKYMFSAQVLKWSSVLSMACDPLARFLTSFYRWYNVTALSALTLFLGVTMVLSSTSSNPLFSTFTYGGIARTCLRHLCLDYHDDVIKMVAPTCLDDSHTYMMIYVYV
ncbi:hypothetical protein, variant 1 [Aphanomyces astaci]|uniref:Uncharacterized protein n=1 Tax=Aphanomyces astaci TaxID=112090 RepID=W4FW64_APHAT|nr:hypothetical protein, variant 1 [Aphanomyces astaci]ETV70903.1 hypothetical protein, variant 1 [Aphanomyces astaci]|eukprot:XP_009839568.1 hypothetical protein, variant 1 [Aphanomyces astaci]